LSKHYYNISPVEIIYNKNNMREVGILKNCFVCGEILVNNRWYCSTHYKSIYISNYKELINLIPDHIPIEQEYKYLRYLVKKNNIIDNKK